MGRDRGQQVVRQWRLLVELRRGPRTLTQLASALGVTVRTIRRDLADLAAVPFPLRQERPDIWSPKVWMVGDSPAWPRGEVAPVAEVRSP